MPNITPWTALTLPPDAGLVLHFERLPDTDRVLYLVTTTQGKWLVEKNADGVQRSVTPYVEPEKNP